MSGEEWLAEFLSKVKPLTTAQRDVLVPAFRQGAEAAAQQRVLQRVA